MALPGRYGSGTSSTSTIRTDGGGRAGRDRLVDRLGLRLVERGVARQLVEREDPVDLAADLRDRRADRVRDGEVVGLNELGGARQRVAEQDRCRRRRRRPGSGRRSSSSGRPSPRAFAPRRRDLDRRDRHRDRRRRRDRRSSARPAATARSVAVSVSPPKTSARGRQLVADAVRTDRRLVAADVGAAAEAEREDVRHAEVRPHAADVDRDRRLARKAVLQHADVGGRAADVDHRAVVEAREEAPRRASSSSARRRTSRPGSARRSRRSSACRRSGSGRPGASIPSSASAARNAATICSASSRRQAFMIVAFSRSSRPIRPISCERLIDSARQLLAENRRGLLLHLGVHRREDGRDRDRADARPRDVGGHAQQLVRVERRDLAAVELVAAVAEIDVRRRSPRAAAAASRPSAAAPGSPAGRAAPPPSERAAWPRRRRS